MSSTFGAAPLPSVLLCTCIVVAGYALARRSTQKPDSIPTVGAGTGPLATVIATWRSVKHCQEWIADGYRKYTSSAFRVRMFHQWVVVISGSQMIDELHRAPDSVFSGLEAGKETLQAEYTLPHWRDGYEIGVALVKTRLTRSLAHLFPAAVAELDAAFSEEITSKLQGSDWTPLNLSRVLPRIICRTSNRLFIGLPLCRDPDFVDLNVSYAVDVILSARFLALFPPFMRPCVFATDASACHANVHLSLKNFLDERRRQHEGHGKDWQDKPDDYLQWLLDNADPADVGQSQLVTSILRLNFAAIHTTTMAFRSALYHVAANLQLYQEPMRAEVHDALSEHGWSTAALQQMHKLDSLFREVLRFYGARAVTMNRKALQDFTFSNGITIKRGQSICIASRPTHFDESIYTNAAAFDAFRFCADTENAANRLVATSTQFLSFGTGKHACPGRFWAANELKALMAYMLVHYDVRMEQDGVVPPVKWLGGAVIPDTNTRVLFRRREAPQF
ncbi:cytochrome P450 [Auricularia subglabra TFB-10046 SS5]|nr:cytochrome P450 [Auricularia subglabra TFB-10046 SS5]